MVLKTFFSKFQHKSRKLLAVFLYLSIYIGVSTPLMAIDFYDTEILVFQYTDIQEYTEKLNTPNVSHIKFNLDLTSLLLKTSTIEIEPVIDGYLSTQARDLATAQNYRIIFYGGWSQKTSNRKNAPYVEVNLPEIYGRGDALTGVIRLFATDLLYIDVLMRYTPPATSGVNSHNSSDPLLFYFIDERRRVKFDEVHFFDHPKFGVLVSVRPIK